MPGGWATQPDQTIGAVPLPGGHSFTQVNRPRAACRRIRLRDLSGTAAQARNAGREALPGGGQVVTLSGSVDLHARSWNDRYRHVCAIRYDCGGPCLPSLLDDSRQAASARAPMFAVDHARQKNPAQMILGPVSV
jgi:hypothetical protein